MRALLRSWSSNTLFLLFFFCSNTLEYAECIGLTGTGSSSSSSTTSSSSTSNKHDNENISANTSRRVGHLDHWDSFTMATYFGLDWETAKPLPSSSSTLSRSGTSSSTFDATTASSSSSSSTTAAEAAGPVDEYTGYDAAVLFYASWCRNCHALAPLWDQIATLTKAGTRKSNVIMSLFDCEKNAKHTELCSAVGVTHYPTMLFVGAGPYVNRETSLEKKLRKKLGVRELKRTTKFKGNWQFGQEIMDWIRVSHGLSRWYRFSRGNAIMRFLRGLFRVPFLNMGIAGDAEGVVGRGKKVPKDTSLPVGVPNSYAATSAAGSAATGAGIASSITGSADASLEVFQLKQQLKETQKKHDEMEQAATHASLLLNVMMLPSSLFENNNNTNNTSQEEAPYIDTFAELTTRHAWTVGASNPKNDLLKSCMADLSVDYCSRLSLGLAKNDAFIESLGNVTTVAQIETVFMDQIETIEPFCRRVDACLANDFTTPECQPEKCPFRSEGACRYVGSCMDPDVMKEYESTMEKVDAAAAPAGTGTTPKSSSAKTGGW
eukprot:CAMPEP_0195522180 /NCGR_PEP_ID=MMETSP0794_2-20130614/20087_1 /TAXON_ID=515487 /ORGANISM="Stephanopyxis turris, Strain CCMP 815" /LENGTH=547 /DNA_ID=CAMNT_0040651871 /DNA_START=120 /DNA_END=1760 /DNA_ORIENTATION=+